MISTVNIQHLESLNDVVAQITGIEQQETIPDSIVRAASQVELMDITPEALRRRLSHGNVYASEKVDAALSNYFRPATSPVKGNRIAMAGRPGGYRIGQVPRGEQDHRHVGSRERVVVAVTGGPESETLIRRHPDRIEVQCRADGGACGTRRRAGRPVGAPDGQDS